MPTTPEYLESNRKRQLDELVEWLRIPSISTLSEHKGDMRRAADWLVAHMQDAGLEHVEAIQAEGNPLVYADWMHAGDDKPTVLIYGHYDVQPVDPLDEWETPPFEPDIRNDNIYARGSADDKGQVFIHVKAVEALLQSQGALPVNVKFIIEGEEEVGSGALNHFVPANVDLLAADVCLISDSHILSPTQPSILYGLRGMWKGEITVTGPAFDLHSGSYGGAIHNANQALCELLAALHDAEGHITVPGFYDNVQILSEMERAALARVPHGEAELLAESGAPAAWGEPEYIIVERTGARPTMEINGMWGGFTGEGFKTVIPSKAHAKISCRLVPDQDPVRIGELIDAYLQELAPPTITVALKTLHASKAFIAPLDLPEMKAAANAYERVFGNEPVYTREGGGIPIVNIFQAALNAPVILMGFGLPDDRLHAPNEKFYIPNFYKGVKTSIAFMEELVR